ncbi:MAG: S26 family signal peptidase, partial [Bacilli bacterium]|nr:S26 family signal peptidase [Bacilli bacterium]
MKDKKSKKPIWGKIVDGILALFIVLLLALEIDIVITTKEDKIPSLFGTSFMRVLTDSMDGGDTKSLYCTKDLTTGRVNGVYHEEAEAKERKKENEEFFVLDKLGPTSLHVGTGITINKISFDKVNVGDVITFWGTIEGLEGKQPISHRVIEKIEEKRTIYCFGDNSSPTYNGITYHYAYDSRAWNEVKEADIIGRVASNSDVFGSFLGVVQSTWFVPLAILIPLSIIAAISAVDIAREYREEKKKEEAFIEEAVKKSGVDVKDERALEIVREKA